MTNKLIVFQALAQDSANPNKYFAVKFILNGGGTYDILVEDLATNGAPGQASQITSAGIPAGGGGAAGANTALSNLEDVAVNAPLSPGADNAIALNEITFRYTNLFLSDHMRVGDMLFNSAGLQGSVAQFRFGSGNEMLMASSFIYNWASTNSWEGTRDLGFLRAGVGILGVTDGGAGSGSVMLMSVLDENGVQVVTEQQPAIADPGGGAIIDAECRAQLIELLAALRTHGLIDT